MKIRIGYGSGTGAITGGMHGFTALVDALEGHGFDSLWLSERITGDAPDPIVGLAVAAGRTRKLKLGMSVLVLPGRNPVVLAKELATLDVLSGGRLLPAFGLGVADPAEQQAFGVARRDRAAWFDEVLPLLRRLWSEERVDHQGPRFTYEGLRVGPKPEQAPMDVWLGGRAPAELRRVGRLGDGWLPSFTTPTETAEGRMVVEAAAAAAGRSIDDEHFGVLIPYTTAGQVPERLARVVGARNPDAAPNEVVPTSFEELRSLITAFVAVGTSKFVLVPVMPMDDWEAHLSALKAAVGDLQR